MVNIVAADIQENRGLSVLADIMAKQGSFQ